MTPGAGPVGTGGDAGTGVRIRAVGAAGVLVEVDDPPAAALAARQFAGESGATLVEVVPGARSLLLLARDPADLDRLRPRLHELVGARRPPGAGDTTPEPLEIPVRYDGADLHDLAERTGLGEDGVAATHSGSTYRGVFSGFAPGFCYLEGLPSVLALPRLPEPRQVVPAGSVAIAGCYSAVYPRSTPGGWRLLGRTAVEVWDPERRPPALIRPGTAVRFVPER